MNFFSSRTFASAVGRAYFPGQVLRQRVVRVGGRHWCLPQFGEGPPVVELPFLDYYEPLPVAERVADGVPYLARGHWGTIRAEQWPDARKKHLQPAPYIEWRQFGSQLAFERHVDGQSKNLRANGRKRARKLEAEVGPVEFTFHNPAPEAFDKVIEWKSAYCVARGYQDVFANPANVVLFRELLASGSLRVSTLAAGGELIAADFGVEHGARFYAWIASYDSEYSKWSPGRLLMEWEMAQSCARGHAEFDLLLGDEEYKWNYASHTRLIGPVGAKPIGLKVLHSVKDGARKLTRKLRSA